MGDARLIMRMSWRDLPINTKGLIVIAIPVLPLMLTAVFYLQSEAATVRAGVDAERAAQNRVLYTRLYSQAAEAEGASRGYVLTGDPALLDVVARTRTGGTATWAALNAQTDDQQQRARLPRLRDLLIQRHHAIDALLGAYQTGGLDSPDLKVQIQRGASAMEDLRAHLTLMVARNTELLAARTARAEALRSRTRTIVVVGTAAGVFGGIFAAVLFTTGITRRLAAATREVARLAHGEALATTDEAKDEIGQLRTGMDHTAHLLAQRDQQLQQRMQELEALTRELEAFSYSVSHDLRAPLRHVVGFASMLQKSAGDALSDQQRRYIRTIVDSAARMGRLIDDLLAFSRTSRTELRRHPVDLGAVVREVQQQLAAGVNGRHIDWQVHALPTVQGDTALLRVVFDNLLANAVKYTRPRARAAIEMGSRPGEPGEVVIYVRDNGVGFDMQYQNKLFGVFQRLHSSDEFDGTGIGLATVRRIVSRHGGRTWAEGQPDAGATFYVALPTEDPAHDH